MTDTCGMQLTSFEPIVEVLVRLERFAEGWHLWVRHRHHAGLFENCSPFELSRLSDDEMSEALACHIWNLTARPVESDCTR